MTESQNKNDQMTKWPNDHFDIEWWVSLKITIEYLGEWETLYNPDFNYGEFVTIRNDSRSENVEVKKMSFACPRGICNFAFL